ncbi:hypothetical protein [Pseudoalteromonas porphyrae]|uniref:Uncharacterized protein n=1 Tax=Pseudoalteromonas porphyrae TaxID=187330 RepID=A0A0N1EP89_9GAMM|nr:hypothetical protein [Pseudoalteromonas porphyrae]KPH64842.1 hypothetical protein ADS77_03265 [Pseudoalteromonas porphyrae]
MTNKLDAILDFIILDENESPAINEQGLPTLKQGPIVKDLAQLIAKGKVQHIEKFAKIFAEGEQWIWANDYFNYLVELNKVTEYNANLPVIIDNEDSTTAEIKPRSLPTAPERSPLKSIEKVLEPYAKKIEKLRGIEFKNVQVSLTEKNQNGLSSLKTAFDLAVEFGAEEQFFPIRFNAESCNGIEIVELINEVEFKSFGLQFILARKAFFS